MLTFIIVGFLAQVIDGALGMAYGVSSTTFLLFTGVSPEIASASVHVSEVFTTFVSGISHLRLKNIEKELLKKILIPGIIGGMAGAYLLTNIPGDLIKPYINLYLLVMGIIIVIKAFMKMAPKEVSKAKAWGVGLFGGFLDAIGGGGWGPIVTSSLIADGHHPRFTVGTVNTAEFFVTLAQVTTFITLLEFKQYWQVIAGLAIGGVIAAPLAAYGCQKLSPKILMFLVGILIIFLNIHSLGNFLTI